MTTLPETTTDDQHYLHGGRRGNGWHCKHCGAGGWPTFEFFSHIPIHKHVELYAESLQLARVLGVDPSVSENIITTRLFNGRTPDPQVARAYVSLARRSEWP
jgi:hypothetical protein